MNSISGLVLIFVCAAIVGIFLIAVPSCERSHKFDKENDTKQMTTCIQAGKKWEYSRNVARYECH